MQGGSSTEREDGEASRVDTATHGNEPDTFGHVGVDDAIDPLRRGHAIDAELVSDAIDGRFGGATSEAHAAAEKIVGIEEAENEVGIRHRRLGAAAAVASRPRLRTGTLGSDVE